MAPPLPSGAGLPSADAPTGIAAGRFGALSSNREAYLIRARRIAGLTVPSLFREQGATGGDDTVNTWQSLGARGVNNLASKMILALFPPGRSFIRLKPGRKELVAMNALDPDSRGALKAEIDKGLSAVEREFVDCVEADGHRATLFDTARHLIVGGNHGLQLYPNGSLRGIHLEDYVTLRDKAGKLLEAVVQDTMAYQALPDDIQAMVMDNGFNPDPKVNPKAQVSVYTHIQLTSANFLTDPTAAVYTIYQECYGQEVPGSSGTYMEEFLPYLFLRMVALESEDYGRSYAEDYEGDLQAVDSLTEIITTGSAAVARFIQFVRPGGMVSKKQLAEADNGAVLTGQAGDVWTLENNKTADFTTAAQTSEKAEARLEAAFLLNSTVQRNAERVTAEEIRYVAQELEDALGGVYANQVVTWQRPYAVIAIKAYQRAGRVTSYPAGSVQVTVIAGMAAIGRNDELAALDSFMQGTIASLGAAVTTQTVNPRIYAARRAAALGIDTDGLIYSEEEASANQQAMQQRQTVELFGPEMVQQIGQYITRSNAAAIQANAKTQPGTPATQPGQPGAGGGGAPAAPPTAGSGLVPFTPSQAPQMTPQAQPSPPVQ